MLGTEGSGTRLQRPLAQDRQPLQDVQLAASTSVRAGSTTSAGAFFASTGWKSYISNDNGASWAAGPVWGYSRRVCMVAFSAQPPVATRLAYGAERSGVGQVDFANAPSSRTGYLYFTSTDGINWNVVRDAAGQANTAYQVYEWLYEPSNGYYYYCSNDGIFRTLNPATSSVIWTKVSSVKANSLASDGNGTLVSCDNATTLQRSTDNGSTWSSYTATNIQGVSYAGDQFIGWEYNSGTTSTYFSTSPDGQTWTLRKVWVRDTDGFLINSRTVGYVGGVLLAIGMAGGTASCAQTLSYDGGITWTTPQTLSPPNPSSTPDLLFGTNDPDNSIYMGFGERTTASSVGQFYYAVPPATSITISGALTDGFKVGDTVNDCATADNGTITSINNSTVILSGQLSGYVNGDNLCRATSSYILVDQALASSDLTTRNIPGPTLVPDTDYFSRLRYRSDDPVVSAYSSWSSFTTSSLDPNIGDAYGGGYFIGQTNVGGTIYDLILAPKQVGSLQGQKGGATPTTLKNGAGASGVTTGETNYGAIVTQQMSTNGAPAAEFIIIDAQGPNAGTYDVTNSTGTGIGGFNDWYMPAVNELQVIYYYLKPGTATNIATGDWATGNPIAVAPQPTTAWTTTNPGQTSVTIFQDGGTEAFSLGGTTDLWWTSTLTNIGANSGMLAAVVGKFDTGYAYNNDTTNSSYFVRAVRRQAA